MCSSEVEHLCAWCPSLVQTPPRFPGRCFRSRKNEGGKTEASFHQILTRAAGRSAKLSALGLCALEEAQALLFALFDNVQDEFFVLIYKCAGIITMASAKCWSDLDRLFPRSCLQNSNAQDQHCRHSAQVRV